MESGAASRRKPLASERGEKEDPLYPSRWLLLQGGEEPEEEATRPAHRPKRGRRGDHRIERLPGIEAGLLRPAQRRTPAAVGAAREVRRLPDPPGSSGAATPGKIGRPRPGPTSPPGCLQRPHRGHQRTSRNHLQDRPRNEATSRTTTSADCSPAAAPATS